MMDGAGVTVVVSKTVVAEGVMVVARKAAQSAFAVATWAGPPAVPVTARAQLSALQLAAIAIPARERVTGIRNCIMKTGEGSRIELTMKMRTEVRFKRLG